MNRTGREIYVALDEGLVSKRIVERKAAFSHEIENDDLSDTEAFLNDNRDDEVDSNYVQESADEDKYEYESDDRRHAYAREGEDIAINELNEEIKAGQGS
jgi:hypothetical protein